MPLSSPALLWVLGLLTLGFPALGFVVWRLRQRRRSLVTAVVGLVLAGQVSAVLLVGAALNDYAYFYGSWSDLWASVHQTLGTKYRSTPVTVDPASTGSAPRAGVTQVRSYAGWSAPARWSRTGRLESVRLYGDVSGLSSQAVVYLPPQYFQKRYAHTTFPAVEVLSGYPSTDTMLVQRLGFQRRLLHEIHAHQARPMVLVLMIPTITYPRDTECTDVPGGPQARTFYGLDVPRAVSASYRVPPVGWGAIGISTGGYCAVKLAMTDPTTFPAAASLSGYYRALQDYTTGDLWGGSLVLRHLNDLEWRLAHQPAPPVSLLLTSSRDEAGPNGYPDLLRFLRLVRPPMQVSTIVAAHGSHTFTTWKPEVPEALRWMSQHLPVPASSSAGQVARPPGAHVRSARGPLHPGGHRPPPGVA